MTRPEPISHGVLPPLGTTWGNSWTPAMAPLPGHRNLSCSSRSRAKSHLSRGREEKQEDVQLQRGFVWWRNPCCIFSLRLHCPPMLILLSVPAASPGRNQERLVVWQTAVSSPAAVGKESSSPQYLHETFLKIQFPIHGPFGQSFPEREFSLLFPGTFFFLKFGFYLGSLCWSNSLGPGRWL